MKKIILIYLLTMVLGSARLFPQEIITGLHVNNRLKDLRYITTTKALQATDTLSLPFSDDFSGGGVAPSATLWSDRYVYINNTFSVTQPTQGIATFDCLDQNGNLYVNASSMVFAADTLTSLPVDLELQPSDSIYLSFLYEAGGISDPPEQNDSLTLSFWAPGEEKWYRVWNTEGYQGEGFRRAMIAVKDVKFLKKGFRFRFISYASLATAVTEPSQAGNADIWNVDYVYLNKARNTADTVFHDAALTLPVRSLVKDYEAMPWKHFRQAYLSLMSPAVTINYRNNDNIVRNITRYVSITDLQTGVVVREFAAGATNVPPFTTLEYDAPLLYTYNSSLIDSVIFGVKVSLITDDFDPKRNDTLSYVQQFTDYFAYDDGTAEAGYGINGQGSRNAMAALRFRSFIPDSVKGINFCFNDAYNNANQRAFDLMVWADDNGVPGTLLGTAEGPVASPGESVNGFVSYLFDKPVAVNGYFWIGWRQLSETFLNTGLDLNTATQGRQYFMISGSWQPSQAPGTIMMRPVMKGEGTQTSSGDEPLVNNLFRLYPNPTTGRSTLIVDESAPEYFRINIYSMTGARVLSIDKSFEPDFGPLSPGIYTVVITDSHGKALSLLRLVKIN